AMLLLVGGVPAGHAEVADRPTPSGGVLSLLPPPQVSDHSIVIAGRTLNYQAKAGTLSLLSGKGAITAEIFHVAYTLRPEPSREPDPQRPITFV
ncbi:MAG: peptidase S10, partial [Mesorhizobium sp.]